MKLLSVVITYYPKIDNTINNIKTYIEDVDCLIIWENTPCNDVENYRIILPEYKHKIIYMGNGNNDLIAYPLNKCVLFSIENDYTHLLTMDQDSSFEIDHFKSYKLILKQNPTLGIYGPNPNYRDVIKKDIATEVLHLITSGSIFNVDLFKNIGLFREDYKIDCVDYEFCLRARKSNVKSYMISEILLIQEFGDSKRTVFGYYTSNYSPFRLYFIIRNNLYLSKDFPEFHSLKYVIKLILRIFVKILLSENNKLNKLASIIKGSIHGYQYKTKE